MEVKHERAMFHTTALHISEHKIRKHDYTRRVTYKRPLMLSLVIAQRSL